MGSRDGVTLVDVADEFVAAVFNHDDLVAAIMLVRYVPTG